jgi:hypothetical protein
VFLAMVRSQDPLSVAKMVLTIGAFSGNMKDAERRRLEGLEPYALVQEWAPYLQGMAFVERVHAKGGWDAVAKLYDDPPRTTEQCLHPERFLATRDEPTPLSFADVAGPEGWTPADLRVLGELNVTLLLRIRGASSKDARLAAAGWEGDLLRTWVGPDGRSAIAWATTWDSEEDASQFTDAMRSILTGRYPQVASVVESSAARPPDAPDAPPAWTAVSYDCGDAPDSRGRTVRRGREVFLVEGLPEAEVERIVAGMLRTGIARVE